MKLDELRRGQEASAIPTSGCQIWVSPCPDQAGFCRCSHFVRLWSIFCDLACVIPSQVLWGCSQQPCLVLFFLFACFFKVFCPTKQRLHLVRTWFNVTRIKEKEIRAGVGSFHFRCLWCLLCSWAVNPPPPHTPTTPLQIEPHKSFSNKFSVPPQCRSYYSDNKRVSAMLYKIGYVFLICWCPPPWKTSFWLSNERLKKKKKKTSTWLSRIRRKSHIPSLYHIPSISPICMVQILGLKREIRIAFSRNGSIRLLEWNRNVIWNQCIRTCLDISNNATSHVWPISLSVSSTRSACCRSPPPSEPRGCGGTGVDGA